MHRHTTAAVLVSATALVAAGLAVATTAQAAASPTAVPSSAPNWLGHAQHLGPAAGAARTAVRVYLEPKGGTAALARTATAMATPGTSSYHHFLTHAQYQATYEPSTASVSAVRSWLRSSGMRVTRVAAGRRYVAVTGSVTDAQRAFGVSIQRYRHDGQTVQAPTAAAKVPAALASSVLTITGLDTTATLLKPQLTKPQQLPGGFRNAKPCSTYYGQVTAKYEADGTTKLPKFKGQTLPYVPCGYVGTQLRGAYEGSEASLGGAGVTVGIVDAYASPTIRTDIQTYATRHGDGGYAAGQYSQRLPASYANHGGCGPGGWHGEQTLDVEAVHAMATAADIRFYAAKSCDNVDLIDALSRVVDEDRVQLVSNSYGGREATFATSLITAEEDVFLQGAVEGISFLFSSGDDGDDLAATGFKQADYPTSDPYVTAVGGTSTAINAKNKLQFETGWGTDKYSLSSDGTSWNPVGFLYGSGGGQSHLFNQPDYQAGITPGPSRDVPDVAMDADVTTGMLIGETQAFPNGRYYDEYRIGGTSLASPLFAGMTALTVQTAGTSLGLLNPLIYDNYRTGAFRDVTPSPQHLGDVRVDYANGLDGSGGLLYSVRTLDQDSSLSTGPGWDYVTGVGSATKKWVTAAGTG